MSTSLGVIEVLARAAPEPVLRNPPRSSRRSSQDRQLSRAAVAREQPYPIRAEEATATLSTSTSRPIRSGTGAPLAPHLSMAPTNQTASSAATSSPANRTARPTSKTHSAMLSILGKRATARLSTATQIRWLAPEIRELSPSAAMALSWPTRSAISGRVGSTCPVSSGLDRSHRSSFTYRGRLVDQAAYPRLRAPPSEEDSPTGRRRAGVPVDASPQPPSAGQRPVRGLPRDAHAVPAAGRHRRPAARRLRGGPGQVRTGRVPHGLWGRRVRPGRLTQLARTGRRSGPARCGVGPRVAAGRAAGRGGRRLALDGGGRRRASRGSWPRGIVGVPSHQIMQRRSR